MPNGDSGSATAPFGTWRTGAARRVQPGAGVAGSAISTYMNPLGTASASKARSEKRSVIPAR